MLCHDAILRCIMHCVSGALLLHAVLHLKARHRRSSLGLRGQPAATYRGAQVQYLPAEMFPAQRWKAVGPQPRLCPPLAASITLSRALAQLFSPATQTDRTTSVSHMKKPFFFFLRAHPNMLPALWSNLGLKRKIQEEEAKGLFCDSSSRVNCQGNQLQPGGEK